MKRWNNLYLVHYKQTSFEQILSTAHITTAVTRICYFRIETYGGKQQPKMKIDFTKDKAAEADVPRGQLRTERLVSWISRPMILIGGQFVGRFLRLVPRNKLLTPVASYSVFSSQKTSSTPLSMQLPGRGLSRKRVARKPSTLTFGA